MFKIPFSISSIDRLKKRAAFFENFIKHKKNARLSQYLDAIGAPITREQYLAICIRGAVLNFVFVFIISSLILYFLGISDFLKISSIISTLFSLFLLFLRVSYPKTYMLRKQRDIERNLIPCLQDMLVQLNSGIPIFTILVNLSYSNYGALSLEFKKAVKKINAGFPQIAVLEEIGDKNPSVYFRRALWQISNGLRAGSDISIIIRESIRSLSEEQLIQIQNYGSKLNPLIMFYMLFTVILPALAITFLTILASFVGLSQQITTFLFVGLLIFVVFLQIMFLGLIKSMRPSLI